MLPLIFAAIGGYLIADSQKQKEGKKKDVFPLEEYGVFKEGGDVSYQVKHDIGEVKKAIENKTAWKTYNKWEDRNLHSMNVVLLAYAVGDEKDQQQAYDILQQHEKIGYMPQDLLRERDEISKRLFPAFQVYAAKEENIKFTRAEDGMWIKDAIKHKGALRKEAKREGLIKGNEKLSKTDLKKLEQKGGKTAKRARLAETLKEMH
jgi:hypothetical protein